MGVLCSSVEQERAEEKSKSPGERLKILFEFASDACYLSDLKGAFIDGNRAVEEISGYKKEELIGKNFLKLGSLSPVQILEAAELPAMNALGKPAGPDEFKLQRKDGTEVSLEVRTFPVKLQGETLVLGIARDITRHKQMENILREERDKAQRYLDIAGVIFIVLGADQKVKLINKKGCEVLRCKDDEIIGKNWFDNFLPEESRNEVKAVFDRLMAGEIEPVEYFENAVLTRQGEKRIIAWHNTVLKDEANNITGAMSSGEDITESNQVGKEVHQLKKELEQRVVERTAQLQAANTELDAFIYSVSHDLRAPLRSIGGFSQILLEDYAGSLDEESQGYLRRIQAATHRMGQLIDDLLELSRLTRREMSYTVVDLSAAAREIMAELRTTQQDRQVECNIKKGVVAKGDAHLLRVVLDNLLRNAWKFTESHPCAKIEFGTKQHRNGEKVYFVRDDGAGFDMAYAGKLFIPFQRLHSAAEFEGTGIGLATVKRIIHSHGGEVWAESAVEQGATFYFTLGQHHGKPGKPEEPAPDSGQSRQ